MQKETTAAGSAGGPDASGESTRTEYHPMTPIRGRVTPQQSHENDPVSDSSVSPDEKVSNVKTQDEKVPNVMTIEYVQKLMDDERKRTAQKIKELQDAWEKTHREYVAKENQMKDKIDEQEKLINTLQFQKKDHHDLMRLKPMDAKDVKKPDEYDGDKEFHVWYERLKDLLASRNSNWHVLLKKLEQLENPIKDHMEFTMKIGREFSKEGSDETEQVNTGEEYARQLRSYLRSYTKGAIHQRVSKAETDGDYKFSNGIFEVARDLIAKGRNRNPYRLVAMKAEILSPPRAKDAKELETVLSDWKHKVAVVHQYDDRFELTNSVKETILKKMVPREFLRIIRERFGSISNFEDLEQALIEEMAERKIEDEENKKPKSVNNLNGQEESPWDWGCNPCSPGANGFYDAYNDDEYYWDPMLGAVAMKSEADGPSAGSIDETMGGKGKDKGKGGKRGPRQAGPCWQCGGPHFQRECPLKGQGKGPAPAAWSAWRPGSFPGPSQQQWRAWMPRSSVKGMSPLKGKGKGFHKGKGFANGKGGKGPGRFSPYGKGGLHATYWDPWNYPSLGQVTNGAPEWSEQPWQVAGSASAMNMFPPLSLLTRVKPIKTENAYQALTNDDDEPENEEVDVQKELKAAKAVSKSRTPPYKKRASQAKQKAERKAKAKPQDSRHAPVGIDLGKKFQEAKTIPMSITSLQNAQHAEDENSVTNPENNTENGVTPEMTARERREVEREWECYKAAFRGSTCTAGVRSPDIKVADVKFHDPKDDDGSGVRGAMVVPSDEVPTETPLSRDDVDEDAVMGRLPEHLAQRIWAFIDGDVKETLQEQSENGITPLPNSLAQAIWALQGPRQDKKRGRIQGNLFALTTAERVEAMRQACKLEREVLCGDGDDPAKVAIRVKPLQHEKPVNSISQGHSTEDGEWQLLSMVVDSGAAETVIPHTLVRDHPIAETEDSKAGACFASATGDPIPNLGEQVLPLCTAEGTLRSMRFQAAPVSKALGSVYRICEAGHRVVFDSDGAYIENKSSGELNWLRLENGNYVLDTWVMPAAELRALTHDQGFPRQP